MLKTKGNRIRLGWLASFILLSCFQAEQANAFGRARNGLKDNRPDAALAVLNAFQGTCGSQGIFTQSATAQTQAIINVIETLKTTEACKPFVSELATIQTAASQIQSLQNSSSYVTYQTDQRNYQILTLALQDTTPGAPEAKNLQDAMSVLRLQMYVDQASYDVTTQTSRHNLHVSQATQMLNWGSQLATSSASLSACLKQSPIASIQLGTNLAAFGGTFISGIYGAAASVIGQLITSALQVLHDSQYVDAIYAAQSNQMSGALSCALESMTDSYCNADDSYALLDLARKNRLTDYSATPLWQGIDILSRQLPALNQWLGKIQNAVPPRDVYQAAKQDAVYNEKHIVQVQNNDSTAAINSAIDQSAASASDASKSVVIENAIADLSRKLAGKMSDSYGGISQTNTPFSAFKSDEYIWACWLVQGYGPDSACPERTYKPEPNSTSLANVISVQDYLTRMFHLDDSNVRRLTEQNLLKNWEVAATQVQALVDSDFARIFANAGTILSSAATPQKGYPVSPVEVLQNVKSFLVGMSHQAVNNPRLALTLEQEKQKVDETLRQLNASDEEVCAPKRSMLTNVLVSLTPAECQVQRLLNVFQLFQLQNGTQVFLGDMDGLVNIDLQNRFKAGDMGTDVTSLLRASGQDLAFVLSSAGLGNFQPFLDDLNGARKQVEENVQVFRQFFVKAFQKAVKVEGEYAQAEDMNLGLNRPHGQSLAELCMLWVLTSNSVNSGAQTLANWPDLKTQKICEGAIYFNANSKPDASGHDVPAFEIGKLAAKVNGLTFQQRACMFHHYKTESTANTRYNLPPRKKYRDLN